MLDFLTAALYKFVELPDFAALQAPLLACCEAHGVKGTLLLAAEGINGTIAGSTVGVHAVLAFLRQDARLAALEHKEAHAAQMVVQQLQAGQRVAYVSDAGTPGVSDPGARLVAAVQAAGLRCIPLPGASSVTSALSVAGAVAPTADSGGFLFAGFLPPKGAERAAAVQRLAAEPRCVVLLEAPHRIAALADTLADLGERPVTLARELTKQFEEVSTHPARELAAWLAGAPQRVKGEFVVLLHPLAATQDDGAEAERVLRLLLDELPTKTAVKLAADIAHASRNTLYERALQIKRDAEAAGEHG